MLICRALLDLRVCAIPEQQTGLGQDRRDALAMYLSTGRGYQEYGAHEQSGIPREIKAVRQTHSQTGYILCPFPSLTFL